MTSPTKTQEDLHIQRKLFHFCSVFIIFLCMVALSTKVNWMVYIFAGIPLLAFDYSRQISTRANRLALAIGGPLLRQAEMQRLSGASYAVISVGLVYFAFPPVIAQLSVLFMAIGDPVASFFGLLYGKTKVIGKKSLEGFLAGWIFCSLAAWLFLGWHLQVQDSIFVVSAACGFIGAVAELIPVGRLDDNLSQPLISASIMALLFTLIGGVI